MTPREMRQMRMFVAIVRLSREDGAMDETTMHAAASKAMNAETFERRGRSRWFAIKPNLVWLFELDRGSHSSWAMMVGAQPTDRGKSLPSHANECSVYIDYSMLGSRVPDEAIESRFDDHKSYFTMAFDHRHDLISDGERDDAFRFMAEDLRAYADRIHTTESLLAAVADRMFDQGFVDRALGSRG